MALRLPFAPGVCASLLLSVIPAAAPATQAVEAGMRSPGSVAVRVNSPEALARAVDRSRGGEVISVAPGRYGAFAIVGRDFDRPVTVMSADAGSPAVFDNIQVLRSSGLILQGLEVQVVAGRRGVEIGKSSNIRLTGFKVHGVLEGAPQGNGSGVYLLGATNVVVEKSEFYELTQALTQLDNTGMKLLDNFFHDLRVDEIRGGGSNDVEIARNFFTEFHRSPGDHSDAIQFWTTNTKRAPTNISIHDNFIFRAGGTPSQGIFMGNEWKLPYSNVSIVRNVVYGGMPNGIAIGISKGVVIRSNLVLGYRDMASKIRVQQSEDVLIEDNTTSHFVLMKNGENIRVGKNNTVEQPSVGDTRMMSRWLKSRGRDFNAPPWPIDKYVAATAKAEGDPK